MHTATVLLAPTRVSPTVSRSPCFLLFTILTGSCLILHPLLWGSLSCDVDDDVPLSAECSMFPQTRGGWLWVPAFVLVAAGQRFRVMAEQDTDLFL